MQAVTTVGFDIAKNVFQVHGVDAASNSIIRQQLRRRHVLPFFAKLTPCVVGIEACATAHYWARELKALGHTVKLMPPIYVKPYAKRQKNDAADAEARRRAKASRSLPTPAGPRASARHARRNASREPCQATSRTSSARRGYGSRDGSSSRSTAVALQARHAPDAPRTTSRARPDSRDVSPRNRCNLCCYSRLAACCCSGAF